MGAKFNEYTFFIRSKSHSEADKKEAIALRDQFLAAAQKVGGKGVHVLDAPENAPMALIECTDAAKRKLEAASLFVFPNNKISPPNF